ncbi:MAG TPA: undecaprenyldiphospho-muramoylpentapeptide beta-N-acetylglucosaminyltransferase, partial [Halothiobacillaceae bacterium]|nr:undecaprenyldiphospho-muramoylpentapeptide beta-N-acetylglucosaminyltransferase [Halothiobacillaceae bacterium]
GGHVLPALEIARRCQKAGYEVRWIGTEQGLESRLVPKAGFAIDYLDISGLRGKGLLRKLTMPLRLIRAVIQARGYFKAHPVALVVGMGGYAAGPGGLAAAISRIPLVIHEQNAVAGLTNRVLAQFARETFAAYPQAFPSSKTQVSVIGNPVRQEIAELPAPEVRFAERSGPVRVLVLGGSLGARAINELLPPALLELAKDLPLEVRHQCGADHLKATQAHYDAADSDSQLKVRVEAFIDDMADAYAWADFVIARAGAMSVAEIATVGLSALFIPFPYAVDDHQTQNAAFLAKAGGAEVIDQSELNQQRLLSVLKPILSDRAGLLARAQAARATVSGDVAESLTRRMLTHASVKTNAEVRS